MDDLANIIGITFVGLILSGWTLLVWVLIMRERGEG